jgi:hypothetical protein
MDPVLDRVRAANPATEDEFAGLADFTALQPPPRRRPLKRLLALPAIGAAVAAVFLLPTSAPQASAIIEQASEAAAVGDGILYARSTYRSNDHTGSREIWVRGDEALRWKGDDGAEEVYKRGEGTTRRDRNGNVRRDPAARAVPTELFRVGALLERARDVGLEESGDAYVLRWREGPAVRTLWVDKRTFTPRRLTDRSAVNDFAEDVQEFKTLPDTPENRRLMELGAE